MLVTWDTIVKAGAVLGAATAIIGALIAVYKLVESIKDQKKVQAAMQEELTIICYGLKGALEGLIENGCNGPCKDALSKLDKHLNKAAHDQNKNQD